MRVNRTKYEKIIEELEDLRELSQEIPVVVEGRNDEKALRDLGINGEVYHISDGTPFYEFCEEITGKYKDVILFTDTDTEGQKIAKRFKGHMSQMGVRVNDRFRLSLMGKLETHQVEHLFRRLKRTKEQLIKFK
ncbi:MAG: toprim domain-containing protein [Candidatus Hydrothermarchaeaceae archaeon]|jgi:5S rRNA maturation endonuclease (ribonuclease M5)